MVAHIKIAHIQIKLLVLALTVGACSQASGTVIGTVINVEGDLTEVHSFTVLVEGEEMVFVPTADGQYAYPLPHLRVHLLDGTPVRVGWERRGDQLLATTLDDA